MLISPRTAQYLHGLTGAVLQGLRVKKLRLVDFRYRRLAFVHLPGNVIDQSLDSIDTRRHFRNLVLDYPAACRRALAASARVSSELLNWSSSAARSSHFRVVCGEQAQILTVRSSGSKYLVSDDQSQCTVEVHDHDGTQRRNFDRRHKPPGDLLQPRSRRNVPEPGGIQSAICQRAVFKSHGRRIGGSNGPART